MGKLGSRKGSAGYAKMEKFAVGNAEASRSVCWNDGSSSQFGPSDERGDRRQLIFFFMHEELLDEQRPAKVMALLVSLRIPCTRVVRNNAHSRDG
jgi:hypothetical protein